MANKTQSCRRKRELIEEKNIETLRRNQKRKRIDGLGQI